MSEHTVPDLAAAADAVDLADGVIGAAVRRLAATGGPDAHQVLAYDVAHAAAAAATARALLDYGTNGEDEAAHRLRLHRRDGARPPHPPRRPGTAVGRRARRPRSGSPAAGNVPGPRVPVRARRDARSPAPRRRHGDGPGHVPLVRRQRRRAARRARPSHQRRRARGDHRRARRARGVRPVGPGRVRGLQRGRRSGVPGDGHRDRGAQPGEPRDRGIVDHSPRDPHPGARPRRDGGPEEALAAAAGHRRGDGGRRRDRARLRQRCRRPQGHRHAGGWSRRHAGVGDQRGQDVVHVRRPRRRAHAARPHRPRSGQGSPRPAACSSSPSRAAMPTGSSSPRTTARRTGRAGSAGGRSTRSAIAACTATSSPWRTGGCRPTT